MTRSHSDIINLVSDEYISYLNKVKKDVESFCQEDENIGKLIEIFYNTSECDDGTFEIYENEALDRIIHATGRKNHLYDDDYHWGHEYTYILESILDFIHTYIHTSEKSLGFPTYGFILKVVHRKDGTIDTIIYMERFNSEQELLDNGYTNKAGDLVRFIEEYASAMVKSKKGLEV